MTYPSRRRKAEIHADRIATLTAERDAKEAERAKLWKEKREAVSYCHVDQAAADTLRAENERLLEALEDLDRTERQELGAALSLRSWHKAENAHNRLRDKLSSILMPSRSARIQAALKGQS